MLVGGPWLGVPDLSFLCCARNQLKNVLFVYSRDEAESVLVPPQIDVIDQHHLISSPTFAFIFWILGHSEMRRV